jgi:hypothetical protein
MVTLGSRSAPSAPTPERPDAIGQRGGGDKRDDLPSLIICPSAVIRHCMSVWWARDLTLLLTDSV